MKGCNKGVTLTTSYGLPTPGMAPFSLNTDINTWKELNLAQELQGEREGTKLKEGKKVE